jgi:molecular chaperone DnaK (HSP70)
MGMKKILFTVTLLFLSIMSVNASTSANPSKISIENIKITIGKNIGYNEELEVKYSINPSDATNKNLVWSLTGIKKGITAVFVSAKTTTDKEGTVKIQLNNTTSNTVTLKLVVKQNGKTLSTTKLNVESKTQTIDRVVGEVKELISNLDEKINNRNYETNKESINKIDELLTNNEEIKELIDEDLLTKYNNVKEAVAKHEENSEKTFTIVISVVLVAMFITGMFLIFRKEGK